MKKTVKQILSALLVVVMLLSCVPVNNVAFEVSAASFNDINQSGVFVKQQTDYTCTLASAVMLVRRTAMATGNNNWSSITEASMRGTAWKEGEGLYHNFTYAGISVGHSTISSNKKSTYINLLKTYPQGVVAWNGGNGGQYHAVLLTDYDANTDTFYCADPVGSAASGRIPLASSTIVGSGQDGKINNLNHYWYVKSPTVSITTIQKPTQTTAIIKTTYPSNCTIKVMANSSYIKSLPCSESTDKNSKTLETASKNAQYKATELVQNKAGNLWYKVKTKSGSTGYLYSGDTSYVSYSTDDIKGSGITVPTNHTAGKPYGLTGSVSASYNQLTAVSVQIYKGNADSGTAETGASASVSGNSYSFSGSTVDNNTVFNVLPVGTHTYVVRAAFKNYIAKSATEVQEMTGAVKVYKSTFNVVNSSSGNSSSTNTTPQKPTKTITPTNGGTYKIASAVGSDKYLDFACTSNNVQIYENCDNHSDPAFVKSQYFIITHVKDGWYKITNTGNGKVVDVYDASTASGANIWQCNPNGTNAQLFRFLDAGDGYCYIQSKLGTFVDVEGAVDANNTNVWAYEFNGSNAQKWKLELRSKPDTQKPSISDVVVSDVTSKGFTISCKVSDNVGIKEVLFPVWTTEALSSTSRPEAGQDDIIYHKATLNGDTASCYIPTSEHNNSYGEYVCDPHIYDTSDNLLISGRVYIYIHKEESVPGKAATCTAKGLTEGKKCSVCGTITVVQTEIPATGHKETAIPGKAATCTAKGLTEGKKCSVCGTVTVAQTEIPATGHKETAIPGKAATCTAKGLTEGKKCSVCGTVTVAQTETAVLAHKDDNGDYKCDFGCSYEFEKPAETIKPEDKPAVPDEPTSTPEDKPAVPDEPTSTPEDKPALPDEPTTTPEDTTDKNDKEEKPEEAVLAQVENLKVKKTTVSSIKLSWKAVEGAEKYKLYYSTNGKKWKTKITSKTTYSLKKLSSGQSYQIKVKAIAGDAEGEESKVIKTATRVDEVILDSVKSAKKAQATVKWEKTDGANGYVVEYSTSKKFTSKTTKKVTIKKGKTVKTTLKKLKSGKKYYVRVKAYKTVNGKNIYGARSGAYSVKVK